MDFTKICINSIYGHENKPKEKFQGYIKIKTAKFTAKILKCTLSSDWVS